MREGLSSPAGSPTGNVEERVLREGWTLHQRLQAAAGSDVASNLRGETRALDRWLETVAPRQSPEL